MGDTSVSLEAKKNRNLFSALDACGWGAPIRASDHLKTKGVHSELSFRCGTRLCFFEGNVGFDVGEFDWIDARAAGRGSAPALHPQRRPQASERVDITLTYQSIIGLEPFEGVIAYLIGVPFYMKRKLVAAGILLCLPSLSVLAQSESKDQEVIANGQQFGSWNVACEAVGVNQTACTLSQNLFRDTDQAFIARLMTFWDAKGETTYVAARVPVGAHLPSGFAIKAESSEKVHELTWQTCTPNFCEAMAQIEPAEIEALSSEGGVIYGSYRPSIQMEPVAFSFKMSGADAGLAALKPKR